MTKKAKIILIISVLLIVGCWATLSFLSTDWFVNRFSLFASLVVGTGSLIMSFTALYISVLSYKNTENQKRLNIEEKARVFIKENNDEIAYIPLCIVAKAYDNHHKFNRNIYNNFNILNDDVQKEVLKQIHYNYKFIKNTSWVDKGLEIVRKFIADNDLGGDLLYDGAKYFHNAIRFASAEYKYSDALERFLPDNFRYLNKIIFINNNPQQVGVSFDDYLRSYLNAKNNKDPLYYMHQEEKPINMLVAYKNLRNCGDEQISYWMMNVVESIIWIIIGASDNKNEIDNDISIEETYLTTYEDRYLDVLSVLYRYYQIINK